MYGALTPERPTGEGRQRDVANDLGRPEVREGCVEDEAGDLASRAGRARTARYGMAYPSANTASDVNHVHTWVPWRPLCVAVRHGELGKRSRIGVSVTYIAITLNVYHLISTKSA